MILGGCGGSSDQAGERQCSLLDPGQITAATGVANVTEEPFEHEESGDGWWCLYVIDGTRVELQVIDSDAVSAFRDLASRSDSNGGPAEISRELGDGAFRRSNGIPGLVVLAGDQLLQLNELDGEARFTEAVASLVVESCCPE